MGGLRRAGKDATYVALLRGINVGRGNRIGMKDLAALFEEAGGRRVRTYVASGNVIFDVEPGRLARLREKVEAGLEEHLGGRVPLLVRSVAELVEARALNPLLPGNRELSPPENKMYHIIFLDRDPRSADIARLAPDVSPPDEWALVGPNLYWRCPNGLARTRLSLDYFERNLGVNATGRNWNTLCRLIELSAGGRA